VFGGKFPLVYAPKAALRLAFKHVRQ